MIILYDSMIGVMRGPLMLAVSLLSMQQWVCRRCL